MKVKIWFVFFTDTKEWETPVWVTVMAETAGEAWFTAVKYLKEVLDGELDFNITHYTAEVDELEAPCVMRASVE